MNWEHFYTHYWAGEAHVSPEWDESYFRKVLGPLVGRERVLDYGCGLGRAYQRHLVASVKSYVGADIVPNVIHDLRGKGFEGLPIDPATGAISAESQSFDGVVCSEVFEHLFDPLQSARELCRVLKPGGILIATVPNFGYHAWRLQALLRAQVPSEPEDMKVNRYKGVHIRFFSQLMFRRLLRDAGFSNIRIGSFDKSSIWDVFLGGGHLANISMFARRNFPAPLHLRFLQDFWPNVFACRLRAVAEKRS